MIIHSKSLLGRTFISELFMYLPWVALTVLGYTHSKSLFVSAMLICVWKCIGYFWNTILVAIRFRWLLQFLRIFGLVNFILYIHAPCTVYIVGNIFAYAISDLLFRSCAKNKAANKYTKLIGMVVVGFLLHFECLFIFFLTLITQSQLNSVLASKEVVLDCSLTVRSSTDKRYIVIEFVHNFLYYFVFPFIPLMGIFFFDRQSPVLAAAFCAVNWILFINKDALIRLVRMPRGVSQFAIISGGFFISAVIFVCIGLASNMWIILFLFLIQGASGGVSEAFWSQEFYNYDSSLYIFSWKIGGIIGCLVGGIVASYYGIQSVYFLSGIVSVLISIMTIFFCLRGGRKCR